MAKDFNVFMQPKPFYMIFLLEFWERFGFYGLQSIFVVYFVKKLNYSEADADMIFGAFSSLVFGLVIFGGKLGDTWLGTKRTIILGTVILGLGYLTLGISASYDKDILFFGLATIAIGNGLFKANPANLLSRCYEQNDPRLDGAFTMYYMAVNLGALFSLALTPYLAYKYDWSAGFFFCSAGLLLCLLSYMAMRSSVANIGSEPDKLKFPVFRFILTILAIIISIIIATWLLQHLSIAHLLMYCIGASVLVIYLIEMGRLQGKAFVKMAVSLLLIFEALIFFTIYILIFTSINFFSISNVQHQLLGVPIAPESFLSLDTVWVVTLSPVMAGIFNYLGRRNRDISMPAKFALGMILCACAFLVLSLSLHFADEKGIISSNWLILFYALFAVGELLVSALGMSMITKMVPERLRGFLMGAWFLMTAFASIIAGYIATLTAAPVPGMTPVQRLPLYNQTFICIGIITGIIAILMLFSAKYIAKLISDEPVDKY